MTQPIRLALLISGGGTTMEKILLACGLGILKGLIEPVLVIASKYEIGGIQRAIDVGFPEDDILICGPQMFPSREAWAAKLEEILLHYRVQLVGQYGWLPKTPQRVVRRYKGQMINQHNGALDPPRPGFGGRGMHGRRTISAALLYARESGFTFAMSVEATTHLVSDDDAFDNGAVIGRRRLEIVPGDDVLSLAARLLVVEHELQIDVLRQFAEATIQPLKRERPLIPESRLPLLEDCKQRAGYLFPNG